MIPYTHDQVMRRLAIRKLSWFVRYMWSVIEPGTELIWGWYHEALCEHLEAVARGEIKNLVICFPPRMLKSSICSVLFPAWLWLVAPHLRLLTGSYALKLAERDCVRSREVMRSPRYKQLMTLAGVEWSFSSDMDTKGLYKNTKQGHRIATSPEAQTTGEGGDIIMVDDAHNVKDVESPTQMEKAVDWWRKSMSTRVNPTSKLKAKIAIMQRVGQADVAGYCIENGYTVFCVPNEFKSEHPTPTSTEIEPRDPRTEDGELLDDRIRGHAETEALRTELGPFAYAAQMQQDPEADGGNVFQRDWFPYWSAEGEIEGTVQLPPVFDAMLGSWDLNLHKKDKQERDEFAKRSFVSGIALAMAQDRLWLIEERRGQWDMRKKMAEVKDQIEMFPTIQPVLIEEKAAGGPLLEMMSDEYGCLEGFDPGTQSKLQRAYAVQGLVERGLIVLPHPNLAPWVKRWLDEVCKFPFAKNDDRVDSLTQALLWVRAHFDFGPKSTGVAALERMVTV